MVTNPNNNVGLRGISTLEYIPERSFSCYQHAHKRGNTTIRTPTFSNADNQTIGEKINNHLIESVLSKYLLNDREIVKSFIKGYPFLSNLLLEVLENLKEFFPNNNYALTVVYDPEDNSSSLYADVIFSLDENYDDSIDQFISFNEEVGSRYVSFTAGILGFSYSCS